MDINTLKVGKFYKEVKKADDKYILLFEKPKYQKSVNRYNVKAFIIMIDKIYGGVHCSCLNKEDHKLWLDDINIISDTDNRDYESLIKRIFETKYLSGDADCLKK